jgi:hypothetical protein
VVTYNGFTPQAQAAFQAAVNIWASQIQSSVPIRVTANWTTLGSGVLGSASPNWLFRDFPGAPYANTWFGAAVAKKLSGTDLTAGLSDTADIVANFNSGFSWYLGTDGNAGTQFDLMSVVLHELGHGLGFLGSMIVSGSTGSWGFSGFPIVYDRFAINGSSQFLLDTTLFQNPSSALGFQLTGNNLFLTGVNARNANGGLAPKLYAPNPWRAGSSYSHLDEATYPQGSPNSLMTPAIGPGEVIHDPGPILRGIFTDLGWTVGKSRPKDDFDGDGKDDVAVYRPGSPSTWWVLKSSTNFGSSSTYAAGDSTGIPVMGDYDGDGRADVAVYQPATALWSVLLSTGSYLSGLSYQWGVNGDRPVPADYDGDGKTDIAVYRPGTGMWWILRSGSGFSSYTNQLWGASTDVPVPADYDGDGRADIAVYRPSTGVHWILLSSTNSYVTYQWGASTDIPVSADYDGDGKADIAVYRPATGVWWILQSSTNFTTYVTYQLGVSSDVPVPGDYDGDGRTDIAVFRPASGQHLILLSTGGSVVYQWGVSTDVPLLGRLP